jgi:hypothetical protein
VTTGTLWIVRCKTCPGFKIVIFNLVSLFKESKKKKNRENAFLVFVVWSCDK